MHKHLFKNTGGGCLIKPNDNFPCDDTYECKCGEKFKLRTSVAGHRYLPEKFETQEMSEIKKLEQDEINKAIIDNSQL